MRAGTLLLCLLAAGGLLLAATAEENLDAAVYEELNRLRQREGIPGVARHDLLDRAARDRAAAVAAAPAEHRLPPRRPLSDVLEQQPGLWFGRSVEQIDLLIDVADPVERASGSWRDNSQAFNLVTDRTLDAVGIGSVRAADGALVIVSIFVTVRELKTDLATLELQTIRAVNAIRRENGLGVLRAEERLSAVARRHSEDMARRGYFGHTSPDGSSAGDRMREDDQPFRTVTENIAKGVDMLDPVSRVVEGWMDSPGHRKNILRSNVQLTGLGLALDEKGTIYFTQLFVEP